MKHKAAEERGYLELLPRSGDARRRPYFSQPMIEGEKSTGRYTSSQMLPCVVLVRLCSRALEMSYSSRAPLRSSYGEPRPTYSAVSMQSVEDNTSPPARFDRWRSFVPKISRLPGWATYAIGGGMVLLLCLTCYYIGARRGASSAAYTNSFIPRVSCVYRPCRNL